MLFNKVLAESFRAPEHRTSRYFPTPTQQFHQILASRPFSLILRRSGRFGLIERVESFLNL
jgi:hypothetical protein